MKKYDVVILHGTCGSPEGDWFPWLKRELEAAGHDVYVPRFPTPEGQSVRNWCRVLDEEAPRFGKNTILIGHSCGAAYLLHILEVIAEPVAQAVFVSGFADKLDDDFLDMVHETFVNHDFDWETIRRNAGKMTLFHGDNDLCVPLELAQKLSKKLKTPLTIIPGGGHLCAESGFTEFPRILEVL